MKITDKREPESMHFGELIIGDKFELTSSKDIYLKNWRAWVLQSKT